MDILCLLLPVIIFGGAFFVFRNLRTNNSLSSGWGNYYNKKLGLSTDEKNLLNKISAQVKYQSFFSIEFCKENTIDLFLTVYRMFPALPVEEKSIDLFNHCTLELKKTYCFYPAVYRGQIEQQEPTISDSLKEKIEETCSRFPILTEDQEKMLYAADNQRWRLVLKGLKESYADSIQFYEDVRLTESLNVSIVAKRNLYYDSYLFVLDKDKMVALKFYMCYLNVGSESETFNFRAVSKKNQKILFANEVQSAKFCKILDKYNKKKELSEALSEIEEVFTKKRKKVILDESAIKSAKEDLVGVVDLLNEYLEDEEKIEEAIPAVVENIASTTSINVELTNIQIEFLERIVLGSYTLSLTEVDSFANAKGVFKSQLIDGINDLCYDILDDILIEEDENCYTLNERYYKQLNNN